MAQHLATLTAPKALVHHKGNPWRTKDREHMQLTQCVGFLFCSIDGSFWGPCSATFFHQRECIFCSHNQARPVAGQTSKVFQACGMCALTTISDDQGDDKIFILRNLTNRALHYAKAHDASLQLNPPGG